jgi:hypothetical protein
MYNSLVEYALITFVDPTVFNPNLMKIITRGIILFLPVLTFSALSFLHPSLMKKKDNTHFRISPNVTTESNLVDALYQNMELQKAGLSEAAFAFAMKGYESLKNSGMLQNTRVLTICDFSKASTEKRFFVIDLEAYKLLFHSLVSHGRNSGTNYAVSFSNRPSSNMSSLGFFVTRSTYSGKHGYSLHIDGVEKGINDLAYQRAIVVHGAPYVSEHLGFSQGYIGRSLGCPALPEKIAGKVIDQIKDGSCFFIYAPQSNYLTNSPVLQDANHGIPLALN